MNRRARRRCDDARVITRDVALAAADIRDGGLVAIPTETVYGLAADATRRDALERLYAVKGRPADHPSIVHAAGVDDARTWASVWPAAADLLGRRFWPGPLTLVLPASGRADPAALGGTGTVGLRVPDSPLALALIEAAATGLAAPSANRFGRVSPTRAEHVAEDLGEEVDLILDGGPCRVGVESTIVDLTGGAPRVLRPGAITEAMLAEALATPLAPAGPDAPRAPGTLAAHYAPQLPVVLVDRPEQVADPERTALIAPSGAAPAGFRAVLVAPADEGIGIAVRDRLQRASTTA